MALAVFFIVFPLHRRRAARSNRLDSILNWFRTQHAPIVAPASSPRVTPLSASEPTPPIGAHQQNDGLILQKTYGIKPSHPCKGDLPSSHICDATEIGSTLATGEVHSLSQYDKWWWWELARRLPACAMEFARPFRLVSSPRRLDQHSDYGVARSSESIRYFAARPQGVNEPTEEAVLGTKAIRSWLTVALPMTS